MRYGTFKESIEKDENARAGSADAEIGEYLALEETATKMYKMQRRGELPLRVTHNDTKCSNVLSIKIRLSISPSSIWIR